MHTHNAHDSCNLLPLSWCKFPLGATVHFWGGGGGGGGVTTTPDSCFLSLRNRDWHLGCERKLLFSVSCETSHFLDFNVGESWSSNTSYMSSSYICILGTFLFGPPWSNGSIGGQLVVESGIRDGAGVFLCPCCWTLFFLCAYFTVNVAAGGGWQILWFDTGLLVYRREMLQTSI